MNIPKDNILSVSEINNHVKQIIDSSFEKYIYVEGEISQVQKSQLGHIYIVIKDEKSSARCTLWSSRVPKLEIYPEIGLKVIIKCNVTFYEKTGSYQLDILGVSSVSIGKFHELFEKLKQKLKKEGLFDIKFKKNLPVYPKNISVITSLTGSVIQDILKILKRRMPTLQIEVYSCKVQGEGCASSIISQLITINKKNVADIIIIARGGGSLEDLIEYNDEFLARQIYNSSIPIISAIGHETDTTIADLVSDVRAATPSEAAEIATKISVNDLLYNANDFKNQLSNNLSTLLNSKMHILKEIKYNIEKSNPHNKINSYSQTADRVLVTLKTKLLSKIIDEKNRTNKIQEKLKNHNPLQKLNQLELKIKNQRKYLQNVFDSYISKKRNIIYIKNNTIENISPLNILKKGYSLVFANNKLVSDTRKLKVGNELKIKFYNGSVLSNISKIKKN